ncbi:uncharacterized protein K452DRAFT_220436 [Aplosporella prunicola CBS 121167]|uniref:Rab-GAP TBC domain-containing protein n=1 Tax=Aplosporella prunicola CBS 121167 TaxID=1176127 RepID=A0A6A6BPN8_9PEZI|nr:uncharacterized protein K452DRAFT_220436 [Aplosporella prunicola CBS 121167]KAF2145688.1 hypothetical protein K452DRAFT_220436 [Aplosporella prunicola CBS 121167]
MDALSSDASLRRTSSTHSASSGSRKSASKRSKPRKSPSTASLQRSAPTPSDKSLTSFPSLSPSPEGSPITARYHGFQQFPQPPPDSPGLPDPPTVRVSSKRKSTQSIVGSLVASAPSSADRSALFDDTPQNVENIPGNLHHADDKHIEALLARNGPVALVKQLAEDLAQRDAQITALRRKAEERERILKKMLQECEISNLDIETRLRAVERGHKQRQAEEAAEPGTRSKRRSTLVDPDELHPEDSIDKHLARALIDENDGERELIDEDDKSLAPFPSLDDSHSVTSDAAYSSRSRQGSRGWKNYLWNGNANKRRSQTPSVASNYDDDPQTVRSRASSIGQQRRALSNDMFPPSIEGIPKRVSGLRGDDPDASGASSRRSSGSVASWALRLVAGNNQMADKTGALRGRPNAVADAENKRTASMDSTKTTASANLKRVSTTATITRGRGPRTSLGPNGTIKSASPESMRNTATLQSPPPPMNRSNTNLGPVEMDMILPEESRPPTLMQHNNNISESSGYLTDRFGFIYDQRRKKRQAEAAAAVFGKSGRHTKAESLGNARDLLGASGDEESNAYNNEPELANNKPASIHSQADESQSAKRWQDYLKLATFPTELLSHTPAPLGPVTTVEVEDATPKASQIVQKRGSLPTPSANPEPSPSHVTSDLAELALPSSDSAPSTPASENQPDPVKALLQQLTELHDSLQRDKTVKWNDFLRRVRAERKREGDAIATSEGRPKNSMPEALLTDGEIIGIAGLGNKGKVGRAKWKEFKALVLGGIPVAYRAKIWAECSGASAMRVPGYYEDLVANGVSDPQIAVQIQMDINRTLTDNIFFRRGPGVSKLNEVLLAYSRRNAEVGYCQGMNLITACLLLIMPTAEDAFWVLATMIENILPQSYYDHSLLASRADQQVLRQYVRELLPRLSAHFDNLGIELEALTFQWFLSVFTDCLSAEALFRVWDVVLCMHDGSTFLFQVALALLKLNERQLLEQDNPGAVYHYINQQMTNHAISIDGLMQASDALKKVVRRKDVEERRQSAVEHERQVMREREELRSDRIKRATDAMRSHRGSDTSLEGAADDAAAAITDARNQQPYTPSESVFPGSVGDVSSPTTMTSSVSYVSSRDEEMEAFQEELEVRSLTPMPIDEEVLWRG